MAYISSRLKESQYKNTPSAEKDRPPETILQKEHMMEVGFAPTLLAELG
jgi:hypothetical protein